MSNPLAQLSEHGLAVWLDFVSRELLDSGELQHLIERDGVRGVTSNPSIFEKAIGHGGAYDADLIAFQKEGDRDIASLYEHLAISDIRRAADTLRPVYDRLDGADGFISLEVSPYLALDTEDTVEEARRLWKAVDRPNLMVKVPGTKPGTPAIRTLIGEGINVNVTLLFSIDAYQSVADAYMDGLEAYAAKGGDISRVASVASFFVSRIDAAVEKIVAERLKTASAGEATALRDLPGKIAIANAKLAYERYEEIIAGVRWRKLAALGARPQRLLWASTGVKSKELPDTLYVATLVGPDTVNTMPPATMDAVRDHGKIAPDTVRADLAGARAVMASMERLGISLDEITDTLVTEGVQLFADAADKLYGAVARKRAEVLGGKEPGQSIRLGDAALEEAVTAETERWRRDGLIRKLWKGDASLWSGADEADWTGWLNIVATERAGLDELDAFAREVKAGGFTDTVLLGMGGSSLGPEVLAETFGQRKGWPPFHMLDSTDPAQLRAVERAVTLDKTLFIVSSKSGSTLEPNVFKEYFLDRVLAAGGSAQQFVAVTDPGSAMEASARKEGFRRVFYGVKTIGGRYSVLSKFGLVPAAAMGLDLQAFLDLTQQMVNATGPYVPPAENPAVQLGIAMGVAAKNGRDKLTLLASPRIRDLGAWLEQLVAESTGKQGRGIIPIADEPAAQPAAYGRDRLFVYLQLEDDENPGQQQQVAALEQAGQPVVRIRVKDPLHIGQEFFRWEMATAVAGAVLGINPFDQPDVEASKTKTRALTEAFEASGALPQETPIFSHNGTTLYADPRNAAALGQGNSLDAYLKAHFARLKPGDYAALLAYIARTPAHTEALQKMRQTILEARHVATAVGFGPRFLHSTGQAYKGGPDSGVFLQITCDDAEDVAIPGRRYGFSLVKSAQARGDFDVLAERGRRALRVHLGQDVEAGLRTLGTALVQALA